MPFREIFKTLAEMGFWGMLGVEMWGYMHPDQDPIEHAAAARRFVDDLVADAWATDLPNDPPAKIRDV